MKEILKRVIEQRSLTKLTLSKSADKEILRTTGRLTQIKGQLFVTLERFYTDGKARHENIPADRAPETLASLIPDSYKEMNILTTGGECRVLVSKKGKVTVLNRIRETVAAPVELSHNRQKQYILPADEPVDFLMALGVQDENGRIFDKKDQNSGKLTVFWRLWRMWRAASSPARNSTFWTCAAAKATSALRCITISPSSRGKRSPWTAWI